MATPTVLNTGTSITTTTVTQTTNALETMLMSTIMSRKRRDLPISTMMGRSAPGIIMGMIGK